MNRRSFLVAATALALLPATAVHAEEDYVQDLVKLLRKQGYSDISVSRTFLGRIKIVAVNSKGKRELVCNPRTGEILRDVVIGPDGSASASTQTASSDSGSSGSSSGSGNSGSDDDDDGGHGGDDDDDEDHSGHGGGGDDDDNSGHGSSGSGSGGDSDSSGHGSGHDD